MEKNLGHATAYGYAKSKGYTGTEEEFGVLMASYASVAQDASQSASSAAESAQLASNEAQRASQSATSAHNDAETASNIKTDVESAKDTTVDAKNATVEAKNISVEAKNSAISAKDTAESKAQIAEAWAVGQKDGTDVPSTDETYHNNAKYYSEQADIAKIGAESAQQLAQASATSASESASDASTSAQTASQAAQTATSKASEATTAATTATTKASEASTSADTASAAAQTATDKASEATTAATTATAKASEASESATTATTAKTDAESARDAASQSASAAAASAESIDPDEFDRKIYAAFATDTASGAIAHFTDGADDIPMKDVLVHIEPVQAGSGDPSPDNVRPITGWTGTKVTRTGKNLLDGSVMYKQGADIFIGTSTYRGESVYLKPGTYTFSVYYKKTIRRNLYARDLETMSYISGFPKYYAEDIQPATVTFTLTKPTHASFNLYSTDFESVDDIESVQLELGSTATDYEPYSGQTYDITFPSEAGTVYGGILDVTSGVLTVTHKLYTFDGSENWTAGNYGNRYEFNLTGLPDFIKTWNSGGRGLSNIGIYDSGSYLTNVAYITSRNLIGASDIGSRTHVLVMPPSIATTVEELKAFLANTPEQWYAPLQTPQTYQLTPQEITSLLGENNVWADTGDSEVTYRVDPALLLDDELSEVQSMIAGVESSTVATKNYSIGDLVIVGDTLYEVTAAIASGETISASNTVATTVDNVIKNRIADSIDDTLTVSGKAADAKTVGDEIDSLKSDLTTFENDSGVRYNVEFTKIIGKYIGSDNNEKSAQYFSRSVPITVAVGDIIEFTASGYNTNIAMIALTDAEETFYKSVARSVDSTQRTYTYTCIDSGYIIVSYENRNNYSLTIKSAISNIGLNNSVNKLYEADLLPLAGDSGIVVSADDVSATVYQAGHYINNSGVYTASGNFNMYSSISLQKGDTISFNAKGYNTNVAILAKINADGTYTPLIISEDSDVHDFVYFAPENMGVVISSHINTVPRYSVFSSRIGVNWTKINDLYNNNLIELSYDAEINTIADNIAVNLLATGCYIRNDGAYQNNSGSSNFKIYGNIILPEGSKIKFNAAGYNTNVAILARVNSDGTYTPLIISEDSNEHEFSYIALTKMTVVISTHKSVTPSYSLYASRIDENAAKIHDIDSNYVAFATIGVLGDSLASGASNYPPNGAADRKDYAWGKFIEREHGINVSLFSSGGATTRSWLAQSYGLAALQAANMLDCYIIGLGVNDAYSLGDVYLGSVSDVHVGNEDENADTYYGNYSKIIAAIKTKSPRAKIFCITNPRGTNATGIAYNKAVEDIVGLYTNTYLIDLRGDSFYTSPEFKSTWYSAHSTAVGYKLIAQNIYNHLNDIIQENVKEFLDIQWIVNNYN